LSINDKVGVLDITTEPPKPFTEILGNHMVSYEKPRGITTTLNIEHKVDEVIRASRKLKESGSRVIALACTGFSTVGVAPLIQRVIDVPVIDPVVASAIVMYHELKLRYEYEVLFR